MKYIQIAGMGVPLLIVAVGMASWIFSLRADIDVVIDEVAEVSLDTARVNATSDEADQELVERIGELEEMITEIERVQSVITNEYRTIMADHNVTSSWAVPRRVVTTKSRFEKVPVVVILKYRSTAPLTVTLSAVGADA